MSRSTPAGVGRSLRRAVARTVAATLVASTAALLPVSSAAAAVNSTTIVSAARGQLGGGCSSGYDGIDCSLNWCAAFAKWAWSQGGVDVSPLGWTVTTFVNYGDNNGTWHDPTGYVPQPGDAMIFGGRNYPTKASGGAHIGIVESVHPDGTLTEIGGNQGNAVTEVSGTPDQIEANLEGGYSFLGFVSPVGAPAPISSGLQTTVVDHSGKTVAYATADNGNIYENYQNNVAAGPWSGWELGLGSPVGGTRFESSPSAFVDWYGKTVVDAVDSNGNVQENYQTNPAAGPWSGWHYVSGQPGGVRFIGVPFATRNMSTNVIYVLGSDGNIYENWHPDGGTWSGFELSWAPGGPAGGTKLVSSPSVFIDTAGHTVVDAIDSNGNVQENYQVNPNAGPWSGWHTISGLPSGVRMTGTPYGYVDSNGTNVVYATGTDGRVWETWHQPGSWSGWELALGSAANGARILGSPSVFMDSSGKTVVDALDNQGNVQENYQVNPGAGPWSGWHTLSAAPSGGLIGTPNARRDFNGTNVLYGVGGDGNVYENWHQPGSWSGWELGWAPGGRPARFVNI